METKKPCAHCQSINWNWLKDVGSTEERCNECSPEERQPEFTDPAWAAKQQAINDLIRPTLSEGQTYIPPKNEGTVGGIFVKDE